MIRTPVRETISEAARVLVTPRPLLTRNLTHQEGLMTKPTLRTCATCSELRPRDAFYALTSPDGRKYDDATCKRCRIANASRSARATRARRGTGGVKQPRKLTPGGMSGRERKAYWATYKIGKGCADCVADITDYRLLHFDHLPAHKKLFNIGDAIVQTGYYTDQQIADEVAKCDVVCRSCHNARTVRRRRYGPDADEMVVRNGPTGEAMK